MQLRCIQVIEPRGKRRETGSGLTVGSVYDVVELNATAQLRFDVRVIDDEGQPTLWSLDGFEVIESRVSPSWTLQSRTEGGFALGPAAWQEESFWPAYFEGDYAAADTYQRELAKMGLSQEVK